MARDHGLTPVAVCHGPCGTKPRPRSGISKYPCADGRGTKHKKLFHAAERLKHVAMGVSPWEKSNTEHIAVKRRQQIYEHEQFHEAQLSHRVRNQISKTCHFRIHSGESVRIHRGIVRSKQGALVELGGVADHVHILARLSASVAVADVVRDLKAGSSKWVYDQQTQATWNGWQKGYGAFTVSYTQTESVRKYIQNQAEHHRRISFQEEYRDFLDRHGIEYESRYLFEDEHQG